MNDFLPILSGLAGGAMQGLVDKRARELKAAALQRQKDADAATKAYRDEMLGIAKKRIGLAESDDVTDTYNKELNRILDTAKYFGNQATGAIRDVYNPNLFGRGENMLTKFNQLRAGSQQKVQAMIADLLNLGMTPQQAIGRIAPFIPFELLPTVSEKGDFEYQPITVERAPQQILAPIEKQYDELQKSISALTPEEAQSALAGSQGAAFRANAMLGIGEDQARMRYPMAFSSKVKQPIFAPSFAEGGVTNPAAKAILQSQFDLPQSANIAHELGIEDLASQIFKTQPEFLTEAQRNTAREFARNPDLNKTWNQELMKSVRPGTAGFKLLQTAMTGGVEPVGEQEIDFYPAEQASPVDLAKRRLLGANVGIAEQRLREMPTRLAILQRMSNLRESMMRWSAAFNTKKFNYQKGQDEFDNKIKQAVFGLSADKFKADNAKGVFELASSELANAQKELEDAGSKLTSVSRGAQLMQLIIDDPEIKRLTEKLAASGPSSLTRDERAKLANSGFNQAQHGALMIRYSKALRRKDLARQMSQQANEFYKAVAAPGFTGSPITPSVDYEDPLLWFGAPATTAAPTTAPAVSVPTGSRVTIPGVPGLPVPTSGLGGGRP